MASDTIPEGVGEMHARIRTDLVALLRERGLDEVGGVAVPACPDWTVKDVVSHLAGVAADVLSGNLDGVASEQWTGAQVAPRRDRSLAAIVDEWEVADPQVEAVADGFGAMGSQWLMDCLTHDADIRAALGEPVGERYDDADPALLDAVRFATKGYFRTNVAAGRPVARFRSGDLEWVSRDGAFAATAEVAPFELLRGLTGRRSLGQISAWRWDVDPTPVLPGFEWAVFMPAAHDLAG